MSRPTTRKKQIFKAMKFRTIENAKFHSIEIKWVYSRYGRQVCIYASANFGKWRWPVYSFDIYEVSPVYTRLVPASI